MKQVTIGTKRNVLFDITRALCVIWIVSFWHIGDYINYTRGSIEFKLGLDITTAVLACFTFMSGFFLRKYVFIGICDIIEFYKKRFIRFYLLLFLSATSLYLGGLIIHQHFYSLGQYLSIITGTSCFVTPAPPTLWYFGMMIMFYLITPILRISDRPIYTLISSLVFFAVFYILKNCTSIQFDDRYLQYFPFYVLGLIFPRKAESIFNHLILGVISGVSFVILFYCFKVNYLVIIWMKSITLILVIFNIANLLSYTRVSTLLNKVSYSSMVAYLFHRHIYLFFLFLFNIGSSNSLRNATLPIWLAYSVVIIIFILSYYGQKLYDRICNRLFSYESKNNS